MLVFNTCENDSRVIREAEALVQSGYEVTVIARRLPGIPIRETRNGVQYARVMSVTDKWASPRRRFARLVVDLRSDQTSWTRRSLGHALAKLRHRPAKTTVKNAPSAVASLPTGAQGAHSVANTQVVSAQKVVAKPIVPAPSLQAPASLSTPKPQPRQAGGNALARLIAKVGRRVTAQRNKSRSLWHKIENKTHSLLVRLQRGGRSLRAKWQTALQGFANRQRSAFISGRKRGAQVRAQWLKDKKRSASLALNRIVASAYIFEVASTGMRRRLLRLKPDIIHAHDLTTLPAATSAAKQLGAHLVYDSHELELHRNATYNRYAWLRRGKLERKGIKAAALVITVSDSIADHLRDEYKITRPAVILNSPSLDVPQIAAEHTIRSQLGLASTTPLAIYVGSVTINRGIEMCVRALKHYPELHFATIGPRRKQNEAELAEISRIEGVTDRFHMVDPVPSDAVVNFIGSADVSVLPIQNVCLSYYYCMPNKLFESVLAGLPVAVADLVELRKFVERYRCGLVMDETDPIDIARSIRKIVENQQGYLLNQEQRAIVRKTYAWPAQAARLIDAYGHLGVRANPKISA
jgi:glycosyltransferase involved in cell wall biosynthesis